MTVRYAEVSDAVAIYGQAAITVVCDRDLNGVLDDTSFALHLDMASRMMDAYLLGRYPLPLASVPAYFKRLCVDIARYTATPNADTATLEIKSRYEQAIAMMRDIAKNLIKLETGEQTTEANVAATPQHLTASAALIATDREMTDSNLRDIL